MHHHWPPVIGDKVSIIGVPVIQKHRIITALRGPARRVTIVLLSGQVVNGEEFDVGLWRSESPGIIIERIHQYDALYEICDWLMGPRPPTAHQVASETPKQLKCTCDVSQLLKTGCICGHIKRYRPRYS